MSSGRQLLFTVLAFESELLDRKLGKHQHELKQCEQAIESFGRGSKRSRLRDAISSKCWRMRLYCGIVMRSRS